MTIFSTYESINKTEWGTLISHSQTATWFQTPAAYTFFAGQPELFIPFVFAVDNDGLKGVCVGYITHEPNTIKQFFTRRAIVIGGPILADDATDDEVIALMSSIRGQLNKQAIYIETRNFNDYSRWRNAFSQAGFVYEPHLNFHVDTSSVEIIDANLSKNRKRDIRTSLRDGATILETPSWEQVTMFYTILKRLYKNKVKTPLFPLSFFEHLYHNQDARFLLVEYQNQIVGGTVCVALPNKCVYEWFVAGKDGQFKSVFPSSLATYAGLKYAAQHNCPRFDMMGAGAPDRVYGVRDFKARFGGMEVEYGRYNYVANPLLYYMGVFGVKILKMF